MIKTKDGKELSTVEYLDKMTEYFQLNHGLFCGEDNKYRIKREIRMKNATPKWLSADHLKDIEELYTNCPARYQVDHIVPIAGKNVCGLHVPWNLQYMHTIANSRKGNRF